MLIGSCGRKKDELSDSISKDILLLYHYNNLRLENLAKQNCNAECQLLITFALKMRETSEDMMILSGGVNRNSEFTDPYREGDLVLSIFDDNDLHKLASELISQLNQKDSLSSNINEIKYSLDYMFTQNEGSMAIDRVKHLPVLFLCLELMILENYIYTHLIEVN